jgi:poly(3-hydroxybutyrate) depolymerase
LKSHYDYFLDLVRGDGEKSEFHRDFYDEYNAVLDMPPSTTSTRSRRDSRLRARQRHLKVNGQPVRRRTSPRRAADDRGRARRISGTGLDPRRARLLHGIPADRRFHYDAIGAGHYGIFSGRRWRDNVYPKIATFIAAPPRPACGELRASRTRRRSALRNGSAAPVMRSAPRPVASARPPDERSMAPRPPSPPRCSTHCRRRSAGAAATSTVADYTP